MLQLQFDPGWIPAAMTSDTAVAIAGSETPSASALTTGADVLIFGTEALGADTGAVGFGIAAVAETAVVAMEAAMS
jgi:electron transfer flavoprotein alpha/beta subunit